MKSMNNTDGNYENDEKIGQLLKAVGNDENKEN